MKTKIFSILMLAALLISLEGNAQKPDANRQDKMKQVMMERRENAQRGDKASLLTAEQREVLKKSHLETAKAMQALKNELRELTAHQQTLTTAENADLNAINKNIEKIGGVKTEMAKILAKQHQEFRAQLSDEQRLRLDNRPQKMNQGKKGQFQGRQMRNRG